GYVVLPEGIDFSQLEKNIILTGDGIRNGKVTYTYKGQNVGSTAVILTEEGYGKLAGKAVVVKNENAGSKQEDTSKDNPTEPADSGKSKLYIATGAAVIFLILLGTVLLYSRKKKGQHRR
ncbi:MAG TPA: D-alanyl-D-alanine carboxypeptidase, partial [Lachnospiraceae bacterium]|nr:D-alanyl-D-alanine carboxypeptidase [Lachnospiraceae bacterium]